MQIKSKFANSRYEFVFTSVIESNESRLFQTFQYVSKSYQISKFYRDLKLRAAIIQDKQLILLPGEQIYTKYQGVWNLSSDQGNLGQFVITNVRIVWFATLTETFNVSLPWVQVKCIRIRDSKYGVAVVLETSDFSGGYVLGFKVDEVDKAFDEIAQIFKVCKQKPFYGVQCYFEDCTTNVDLVTIIREEDKMEIVDTGYEHIRSI